MINKDIISSRVKSIKMSPIRKFFNLVQDVPGALSLTIGQPDFPTPDTAKLGGIDAIKDNKTSYTHNQGYIELRREIASYLKRQYGLKYDAEKEICVTVGSGQAIDSAIRTIVDYGDEVLIPAPAYVAYGACTTLSGGKPIYVPTNIEDGFKLKSDMLKKYITQKSKVLVLSYPSNPTGATMSREDLEEIAKVVLEYNLSVISDEIYSELTYDSRHFSIASIEGMRERTVVINGFSKAYSMTGWRLGYAAAPEYLMKHIIKVHQYNVTCAPSISQAAGIQALRLGDESVKMMLGEFNRRRSYCMSRIREMGLKCLEPSGAFYIFPDISQFGIPSEKFCEKLLYEGKLALVPGSAFGSQGEGHVRISYAYSMDVLEEGMNRLQKFIAFL